MTGLLYFKVKLLLASALSAKKLTAGGTCHNIAKHITLNDVAKIQFTLIQISVRIKN